MDKAFLKDYITLVCIEVSLETQKIKEIECCFFLALTILLSHTSIQSTSEFVLFRVLTSSFTQKMH